MKPTIKDVRALAGKVLKAEPRLVTLRPLPTNSPDRHWNYKVRASGGTFLFRFENPLAVRQRGTRLKDEAALLRFFGAHGVAPKLFHKGSWNKDPYIVEEWISGKHISAPGNMRRGEIAGLIRFIAAVNRIPTKGAPKLAMRNDVLDANARRKVIAERLRAGRGIPAFRPILLDLRKLTERGLARLAREIRALPRGALANPVFSYRDITPGNILRAGRRCVAVDWEHHSVGFADPSFSLVVLFRRYRLDENARAFALREYRKHIRAPHLRLLLKVRMLERLLGELTWGLAWVAHRSRIPFPQKARERETKATLASICKVARELASFLSAP